jgi:hypothetical protein
VITPSDNFVSINGSIITISPTGSTSPRVYDVTAIAKVANALTLTDNASVLIKVTVAACIVTALTPNQSTIPDQTYWITTPKITILIPAPTQTPACG